MPHLLKSVELRLRRSRYICLSICLPVLLYGLEVCLLVTFEISSLDFAVSRFFMKLFSTSNIEIIKAF